jgi:ubiquinone biosynthesis protein COQ9
VARDIASRDIPEGLMLVDLTTGAAFKLNRVGALVWKRLDGATDVAAIVADLQTQYRVAAEDLRRDVDVLLADLEKQGLIAAGDPR